jgi:DNA-binding NarL/FixJ family response regulator
MIDSASPAWAFVLNDCLAEVRRQLTHVRIVVVDDFGPWRRYVCSILAEDENLKVVGESSDGLKAIQTIEELRPNLVLLDIQLPNMNGLDVARRTCKISPNTKILFLSSYHSLEIMREALGVGVGFIVKADAGRDLLPIVQAVIRNEPFVRFRFLNAGL